MDREDTVDDRCDVVDLHAEEDGEGVADEPGHSKPKQGQSLLPTARSMYDVKRQYENVLNKTRY